MRHQPNGLENENHLSVMILAENLSSPTQQLIQEGRAKENNRGTRKPT